LEVQANSSVQIQPVIGTQKVKGESQDWRQLFKTGKTAGSLEYHEPTRVNGHLLIQPPREVVEKGIRKWSSALIGQFLDKPLPFYVVKRAVDSLWEMYGKVDVSLLENGLYLSRFVDEQTRDTILEEKLWHFSNKPIILRRWSPGMQLLKLSLASIPIWIKLHNLPLEYWDSDCLGYIVSGIGKPICEDSVTENHSRLRFARVLVEVYIDAEFPKEIEVIGLDGGILTIGVEYPWLPIRCKKCRLFGHATYTSTKDEKAVRVPRKQEPEKVVEHHKHKLNANGETKQGPVGACQWSVVKPRKTPKSMSNVADNSGHWTNSFQLLARVDRVKFNVEEIKKSKLGITASFG
jgi:hypothetical protein